VRPELAPLPARFSGWLGYGGSMVFSFYWFCSAVPVLQA